VAVDLGILEQAAARVGAPGLHARLVPARRRFDPWFEVRNGELLVSERVVERLRPDEGAVLAIDVLLQRRGGRQVRRKALMAAVPGGLAYGLAAILAPGWPSIVLALLVIGGLGVGLPVGFARAALAADDATVALTGDPETLVRAMNRINQDELHVGRWHLPARSDVHRRAERLVDLHRLRLPPEVRDEEGAASCPIPGDPAAGPVGGEIGPPPRG
jgi:hypothetical protein